MLNKEAGLKLITETVEVLAKERKWSGAQRKMEEEEAIKMMEYMK